MIRKSGYRFSEKVMRKQKPLVGVTHLRLSQPGEAPPTPVVVPDDMMPEPPGSGVQIRPREPLSPRPPVMPPDGRPLRGRDDSPSVIVLATFVKHDVSFFATIRRGSGTGIPADRPQYSVTLLFLRDIGRIYEHKRLHGLQLAGN